MSSFSFKKSDIESIAIGLNIEGCNPYKLMPKRCEWYNLIIAVDEPLNGITFDNVMDKVKSRDLKYIEEAIDDFDIDNFISTLVKIIKDIESLNCYKNILIHVHQYTGTTILHETLKQLTGINTILDTTNFFESPTNYSIMYPDIDCLISISQCASLSKTCRAGTFILPTSFYSFDVRENKIYVGDNKFENNIEPYLILQDIEYVHGNILVVNDLWNPTKTEIDNDTLTLIYK